MYSPIRLWGHSTNVLISVPESSFGADSCEFEACAKSERRCLGKMFFMQPLKPDNSRIGGLKMYENIRSQQLGKKHQKPMT